MAKYNRGNDYDQPNAIQQTPDGGYIVGGSSDSNISGEKQKIVMDCLTSGF